MSIYLGNLDIAEIERRAGVAFPQELRDYMGDKKQEEAANVASGKWHCFDIPFVLVCGDMATAVGIHTHLAPMAQDFKEPLQIALAQTPNA